MDIYTTSALLSSISAAFNIMGASSFFKTKKYEYAYMCTIAAVASISHAYTSPSIVTGKHDNSADDV